jgi:uncharacterized protein (TIGR03437 family)
VAITYNNNVQDVLQLYMVSPTQINAVIPMNSAPSPGFVNPVPGLATLSVVTPTKMQTSQVEIAPYAPAILAASENGGGVAMATFFNDLLEPSPVYQCTGTPPTKCVAL